VGDQQNGEWDEVDWTRSKHRRIGDDELEWDSDDFDVHHGTALTDLVRQTEGLTPACTMSSVV
jgi:hypothetical protein